jgi:hypothetical protein
MDGIMSKIAVKQYFLPLLLIPQRCETSGPFTFLQDHSLHFLHLLLPLLEEIMTLQQHPRRRHRRHPFPSFVYHGIEQLLLDSGWNL